MREPDELTTPRRWVGTPYPLGASYDGSGTNFSIFSSVAEGVELCLLGDATPDGRRDEIRIDVSEVDGHIWHVRLPDVRSSARMMASSILEMDLSSAPAISEKETMICFGIPVIRSRPCTA